MMTRIDRLFLLLLAGLVALGSGYNRDFQPVKEPANEPVQKVTTEEVKVEKKVQKNIPDFAAIEDVNKKKSQFFAHVKQMVDEENERLAAIRQEVKMLREKSTLHEREEKWLLDMARKFRVDEELKVSDELYDDLLHRADEIPVSLALVQAANESAWGTSRFAVEANNYFGQWCFTPGCGVVPGERPEGATYEVRKFPSLEASVRSYMHNLNTSHHYEGLRELRSKRKSMGHPVTGPVLAQGLYAYSSRGIDYIEELVSMIESNDLLKYDLEKPLTRH
ncbi:glucosaminidase domain-containing protein [Endozoicomonas sp. 8E]|uniref:glucosaminidase domain-containing protein n=1 Tax=Endozoicomonas sp. 8E TaxID=3035692 RepID=UPI00293924D8|nr:glucosaminidase domain-containing protein [Endozoicomonas sp. 8E]WOG29733.1 glucosaminidase domain-containing protein [Endozoicomonas sp. 8E]